MHDSPLTDTSMGVPAKQTILTCSPRFKASLAQHVEPSLGYAITGDNSTHLPAAAVVALQGLWTNGYLAFTVALDQRVHCWHLSLKPGEDNLLCTHDVTQDSSQSSLRLPNEQQLADQANEGVAGVGSFEIYGQDTSGVTACLSASAVTQVLEPAALDAAFDTHDQVYHLLIAGRGTQLLSMKIKTESATA